MVTASYPRRHLASWKQVTRAEASDLLAWLTVEVELIDCEPGVLVLSEKYTEKPHFFPEQYTPIGKDEMVSWLAEKITQAVSKGAPRQKPGERKP